MINNTYLLVENSPPLRGTVTLAGAKNAVLVSLASLILTEGVSTFTNVPASADVYHMLTLLERLGAHVTFIAEQQTVIVDTRSINCWQVPHDIMKKMRASILVMGPLLVRFGKASVAVPGGCVLGARPIDYHLKAFAQLGAKIHQEGDMVYADAPEGLKSHKIVLEYPSVGATENILMAAALTRGVTRIVHAALEPEVLDLIEVLRKMGARISILPPATLEIEGVERLSAVQHHVLPDRLEAGALLMAAAMSEGEITIPDAPVSSMEVFLAKLEEMGHAITYISEQQGVHLKATSDPRAVSFKTGPYPGFPTDLQAPMMALQTVAQGTAEIYETVFENRFLHAAELAKMGAQIRIDHHKATVTGVEKLYGTSVIATDIRASCALALAGLIAQGSTCISGIHHWKRGYEALEKKLFLLGACISLQEEQAQFVQKIEYSKTI